MFQLFHWVAVPLPSMVFVVIGVRSKHAYKRMQQRSWAAHLDIRQLEN